MVGLNLMKLGLTEPQLNSYLEPLVHHGTKFIGHTPQIQYCSHVNDERKGQRSLELEATNYHTNTVLRAKSSKDTTT